MINRKKIIIIFVIIFMLVVGVIFLIRKNIENNNSNDNIENEEVLENFYDELTTEELENQDDIVSEELNNQNDVQIEELKEQTGLQADNELYEVNIEYDGRKVLNIKASIQFKVAFAGIIKKQKPEMDEIDKILEDNFPIKSGIWVEKQSRDKILEIIKSNTESTYKIDEDGYLTIMSKGKRNDNDKKLEQLINMDKKIILTVNSIYYEVDTVTGEIVEYPFEKLDNYQAYDKIESEGNSITIITSNSNNKLDNSEILKELLQK